jgi:hypothetical protein
MLEAIVTREVVTDGRDSEPKRFPRLRDHQLSLTHGLRRNRGPECRIGDTSAPRIVIPPDKGGP